MHNERHACYKGCAITTRWTEVIDWSARPGTSKGAHTAVRQFIASFSVAPQSPAEDSWQQFPSAAFDSSVHAADNALAAAKVSIDHRGDKPTRR